MKKELYEYQIGLRKSPPMFLGDKLEKVFSLLGIKKISKQYEKVTGRSCGCEKRREALNRII
jgi:hypothetical protein